MPTNPAREAVRAAREYVREKKKLTNRGTNAKKQRLYADHLLRQKRNLLLNALRVFCIDSLFTKDMKPRNILPLHALNAGVVEKINPIVDTPVAGFFVRATSGQHMQYSRDPYDAERIYIKGVYQKDNKKNELVVLSAGTWAVIREPTKLHGTEEDLLNPEKSIDDLFPGLTAGRYNKWSDVVGEGITAVYDPTPPSRGHPDLWKQVLDPKDKYPFLLSPRENGALPWLRIPTTALKWELNLENFYRAAFHPQSWLAQRKLPADVLSVIFHWSVRDTAWEYPAET